MRIFQTTVGLALLGLLAGCYTVPETGRTSMIMISPGEEAALGAASFADIRSKEKVSTNPIQNERVQRVGRRIAAAVGDALPGAKWEFVVFDAPKTVNAFALPGGKVGVYTGLLNLTESDAELAIVMGHEIGHVTARHGAERMTQGLLATAVGVGVAVATENSAQRDLWRTAYGTGALGAQMKFSRDNESEADLIGLRYAAKAGYDPHAALTFWRKMAAQKGSPEGGDNWVMTLFSTHPSDAQRIARLEELVPAAMPLYEASPLRYQP